MAWMLWANPTYRRPVPWRWFDLTAEPAATVMAHGIYGDTSSHYSVYAPPPPSDGGPPATT